jgi:hypothetical protein
MTPKPSVLSCAAPQRKQTEQLLNAIERESLKEPFQPFAIIQLYRLLIDSIQRSTSSTQQPLGAIDFTDATFIYIGAVLHVCTNNNHYNGTEVETKHICMRFLQQMIQDIAYLCHIKNMYQFHGEEDYELYSAVSEAYMMLNELESNVVWQKEAEKFAAVASCMQQTDH